MPSSTPDPGTDKDDLNFSELLDQLADASRDEHKDVESTEQRLESLEKRVSELSGILSAIADSRDIPLLLDHGLYTRNQVLRIFQISVVTLTRWNSEGLLPIKREHTNTYYYGRDIIAFLSATTTARVSPKKVYP